MKLKKLIESDLFLPWINGQIYMINIGKTRVSKEIYLDNKTELTEHGSKCSCVIKPSEFAYKNIGGNFTNEFLIIRII